MDEVMHSPHPSTVPVLGLIVRYSSKYLPIQPLKETTSLKGGGKQQQALMDSHLHKVEFERPKMIRVCSMIIVKEERGT